MDGRYLASKQCLFGGGTAIALRYGEYRESVDVDFLVSSLAGYREIRNHVSVHGIEGLFTRAPKALREVRADQYGIRTLLEVDELPIKLEVILEARIRLDAPGDEDALCGIKTLTPVDMAASKLLANSDRWADDSTCSRDLIDLAMMLGDGKIPRASMTKATRAYGDAIGRDLKKAIGHLLDREGRLGICIERMAIETPQAQLGQRIKRLKLPRA